MDCDAIVNPTDKWLSGSGGTDYAVHKAAGEELDEACQRIADLQVGSVAVTDGYRLPCRYIFHTVGSIWHGGSNNEEVLLRSCYLSSLLKAKKLSLGLYVLGVTSEAQFNNSEISRRRGAVATLLLALRISSLLVLKCTVYLVNNILWPVIC